MSRGLGELQRNILRCLESESPNAMPIMAIAAQTHGPVISRAEYECIRRALKTLERRKLAGPLFWGDGSIWATTANVDYFFEKYCDLMARIEERKCRPPDLSNTYPADKSCIVDQSNTYHVEAAKAEAVA